jgi:hypothetical protein
VVSRWPRDLPKVRWEWGKWIELRLGSNAQSCSAEDRRTQGPREAGCPWRRAWVSAPARERVHGGEESLHGTDTGDNKRPGKEKEKTNELIEKVWDVVQVGRIAVHRF